MDELTKRILDLVAATFDVPVEELSEATAPENLPEWNSLGQLNLVLALEQEFGLQIAPEQTYEMVSVAEIVRILRGNVASKS
jgi:acyl carrier protein